MTRKKNYFLIIPLITIPVIIFLYFYRWKTNTAYGDDLLIFKYHASFKHWYEYFSMSLVELKYRPVNGIVVNSVISIFQKHLLRYYILNVAVQSVNVCLLAVILNMFLRSVLLSVSVGLLYGISRFCYFNINQLLNGGVLEGLAMTFFLLFLLTILKVLIDTYTDDKRRYKALLWSIFFANMCMYTHERYMVLFPFLLLITAFAPAMKTLNGKLRLSACVLIVFSVALNLGIKRLVFSLPYFVGTSMTVFSFSFPSAIGFTKDALLNMLQINTGPDYLVGSTFESAPVYLKTAAILCCGISLIVLGAYVVNAIRSNISKQGNKNESKGHLEVFILLAILAAFCLAPAVITIRLEQRWLQASFSIFIVMLAIAFVKVPMNRRMKIISTACLVLLYVFTEYSYISSGVMNTYMKGAEKTAGYFEDAIKNDVIKRNTRKLFIWEQHNDANNDRGMFWAIGQGYVLDFYQNNAKSVFFADTTYTYRTSDTVAALSLPVISKDSIQIVYIKDGIIDITDQYLKDSLKNFQY